MRFIHTSDWHLGRIFHGQSLIVEQRFALTQIIEILKTSEIDALLIAGDIYDRSIPPVEAVTLLDWFLCEVILILNIPVVMIAGNHDSAERLGFGSKLLVERGLHLVGSLNAIERPLELRDEFGSLRVYGIPYTEPALTREMLEMPEIGDQDAAMRGAVQRILRQHPPDQRAVLLAHAFVTGGLVTDSERPLSVAGAGSVAAEIFEPFAYTALGHLHRPQRIKQDRIQYSGSLLRYSFSELSHEKSVNLVTIGAADNLRVEKLPLVPEKQLRQIKGKLSDLLRDAPNDSRPNDYLLVTLEDDGPVLDPLGKLRPYYPNVLQIERLAYRSALAPRIREERENQSEQKLFAAFYEEVTGDTLSSEQSHLLTSLLETYRREEGSELSS